MRMNEQDFKTRKYATLGLSVIGFLLLCLFLSKMDFSEDISLDLEPFAPQTVGWHFRVAAAEDFIAAQYPTGSESSPLEMQLIHAGFIRRPVHVEFKDVKRMREMKENNPHIYSRGLSSNRSVFVFVDIAEDDSITEVSVDYDVR
jgi:hypothetical protein